MLGNNNAFDSHFAPFGKTAYFHCALLNFFSLPSAPGENKVDAVVSQMQSTPQWDSVQQTLILYLSQVMTSPRRSLTCNQSVQ